MTVEYVRLKVRFLEAARQADQTLRRDGETATYARLAKLKTRRYHRLVDVWCELSSIGRLLAEPNGRMFRALEASRGMKEASELYASSEG